MIKKTILGVCALASLAVLPSEVSARTLPGQAGSPGAANTDYNCFLSSTGVMNVCASAKYWDMPVVWDTGTPGNKTITVSAFLSSGGSLQCSYEGWTPAETITVGVGFHAFPAGSSQQSITVSYVPPGSFGLVLCSVSGGGTATIVGMDYTP